MAVSHLKAEDKLSSFVKTLRDKKTNRGRLVSSASSSSPDSAPHPHSVHPEVSYTCVPHEWEQSALV